MEDNKFKPRVKYEYTSPCFNDLKEQERFTKKVQWAFFWFFVIVSVVNGYFDLAEKHPPKDFPTTQEGNIQLQDDLKKICIDNFKMGSLLDKSKIDKDLSGFFKVMGSEYDNCYTIPQQAMKDYIWKNYKRGPLFYSTNKYKLNDMCSSICIGAIGVYDSQIKTRVAEDSDKVIVCKDLSCIEKRMAEARYVIFSNKSEYQLNREGYRTFNFDKGFTKALSPSKEKIWGLLEQKMINTFKGDTK